MTGQTVAYRAHLRHRWPAWISDADAGLGEEGARLAARLLRALSGTRSLPSKSRVGGGDHQSLAVSLAKHAPAVLVAYVRAASDPITYLPNEVRRELEPGLFGFCDIMTSRGRIEGRGREGEGIGAPFSLGEGDGGEAEREVWGDIWRSWSKKRYVGHG